MNERHRRARDYVPVTFEDPELLARGEELPEEPEPEHFEELRELPGDVGQRVATLVQSGLSYVWSRLHRR